MFSTTMLTCISLVGLASTGDAQQSPRREETIGLPPGAAVPSFKARDQYGREQDNKTVAGENGTVLLFFRSADW